MRFPAEAHALYCEVARRLKWSSYRDRDGFAVLVREAMSYYLTRNPGADQEAKRSLALDEADRVRADGQASSVGMI